MRIFSSARGKIVAVAVTTGLCLAVIPAMHAFASWGPSRPTFTWAHPATYITFNSITDNPSYGDERTFFDGTYVSNPGAAQDKLTVSNNQELSLRVYYHNNAASNLNLVATNTRVKVLLPTKAATDTTAAAYISADNATPKVVADTVEFVGAHPFTLSYEPGTAQLWNNVFRGAKLSDGIVTSSGALIGYDKIDGKVPGCAQYSGYVTIRVKVHMETPPPPTKPKAPISIKKIAEDAAGHQLSAVPTNTFKFQVTCDGNTQTVVYNNTPQAAGECTVGGNVTITEASVSGWKILSTNPQSFTVPESGVTAVFKNQEVVTTTPPVAPPQKPVKPVVKGATKVLPNTGPGEVAGIFAGVSSLGAAAHYTLRNKFRK